MHRFVQRIFYIEYNYQIYNTIMSDIAKWILVKSARLSHKHAINYYKLSCIHINISSYFRNLRFISFVNDIQYRNFNFTII